MLEYKTGCILEAAKRGEIDYLLHGCNCLKVMGTGFAKYLKAEFPKAYEADYKNPDPPFRRIGGYSSCNIALGDSMLTIVNLYTQYDWGTSSRKVEYGAIKRALESFVRDFAVADSTIGLVKIGTGLAGGKWEIVQEILNDVIDYAEGRWIVYEL